MYKKTIQIVIATFPDTVYHYIHSTTPFPHPTPTPGAVIEQTNVARTALDTQDQCNEQVMMIRGMVMNLPSHTRWGKLARQRYNHHTPEVKDKCDKG